MDTSQIKHRTKRAIKHQLLAPFRFLVSEARLRLNHEAPRYRILLTSDFEVYTSDQQYAPFERYRREIADQLNLTTLITDLSGAHKLLKISPNSFDAIGVKLSFRTPKEKVIEFLHDIRSTAPRLKIIYFDGDDDLAIQWPEALELCDLYVKKHVYSNLASYGRQTIGKTNLTDYVHRLHGFDFSQDIIPENRPLAPDLIGKVCVGWNIALDDKIDSLRKDIDPPPTASRKVDIVCRATVNPESWLYHLRKSITPALEPLRAKYNVITPTHRVEQNIYYEEMLTSKICISPFGYGEICWRDFEAVLCGCLVVKPDMSHVRTEPNIFVPNETYVPVSWDYSDLAEKCEFLLNNPKEIARISSNARKKLLDYHEDELILNSIRNIITRVMNSSPD